VDSITRHWSSTCLRICTLPEPLYSAEGRSLFPFFVNTSLSPDGFLPVTSFLVLLSSKLSLGQTSIVIPLSSSPHLYPINNSLVAVYLGALALSHGPSSVLGAFLGFLGIFFPGITLSIGVQSIWRVLRTKPAVVSLLRGVNATAVGLVFTAVYRLWEIGYLQGGKEGSGSLGLEPWWVVVAAVTYSSVQWWNVPPPVAILGGAVGGLAWWGVVR